MRGRSGGAPAAPGRDGETVLQAIRQAERDAARAVDAARRDADERLRAAEADAARHVRGARERGRRSGAIEADAVRAEAHRRADGERARGIEAVEAFRARVAERRGALLEAMLEVVLPPATGGRGAVGDEPGDVEVAATRGEG